METINDLLFVIIGTAIITAFTTITVMNKPQQHPSQVEYSAPIMQTRSESNGCMPLLMLIIIIVGAIRFLN